MDQQDLKLSKKLISSYKKRLEKEILDRSMKLKMPQNKFEEIINNNNELINLKKVLDQQDLKLSKKLITSYKKRLEKEILDRSIKLRMPQNKFEEIIHNNNELINLKKALEKLEAESEPHSEV